MYPKTGGRAYRGFPEDVVFELCLNMNYSLGRRGSEKASEGTLKTCEGKVSDVTVGSGCGHAWTQGLGKEGGMSEKLPV